MTAGLLQKAAMVRADILKMTTAAGSGHPGGSLSSADIMTVLFLGGVLRHDPEDPDWLRRDRFILSKGHVAPVLYAVMARAGYFPLQELSTLRQYGSRLQGHPDMLKLPGIEMSTGSLGQGLSIASGLAYALQCDGQKSGFIPRVFTLLGDGECQEGQVWEAAMFAAHRKLANLIAIIDNNGLQIDGRIEDVCDPTDLMDKFRSFGWYPIDVDGHDIEALKAAFDEATDSSTDAPRVIIARTVKGKGISFMEGLAAWHGKSLNPEQLAEAMLELSPHIGTVPLTDRWEI